MYYSLILLVLTDYNTWEITSAPLGDWYDITSDSTGMKLAAVQFRGYIYTSTSG